MGNWEVGRYNTSSTIAHEITWIWLRRGDIKREIKSLFIAARNNSIRTNYVKAKLDNTQENSKCRLSERERERVEKEKERKGAREREKESEREREKETESERERDRERGEESQWKRKRERQWQREWKSEREGEKEKERVSI